MILLLHWILQKNNYVLKLLVWDILLFAHKVADLKCMLFKAKFNKIYILLISTSIQISNYSFYFNKNSKKSLTDHNYQQTTLKRQDRTFTVLAIKKTKINQSTICCFFKLKTLCRDIERCQENVKKKQFYYRVYLTIKQPTPMKQCYNTSKLALTSPLTAVAQN